MNSKFNSNGSTTIRLADVGLGTGVAELLGRAVRTGLAVRAGSAVAAGSGV
jgi:hypothetical protein